MPHNSGSFSGTAGSQSMMVLPDAPGHQLGLIEVTGPQSSADPLWEGAVITYWGTTDLIDGNGSQTGYFLNRHPNGDIDRGTFSGTIATAGGGATMQGTWMYTGGTGAFAKISGGGTYRGEVTSPVTVKTSWEGEYQLG